MDQLQMALKLAYEKHNGQYDKAGNPYILHPLYVSHNVCIKGNARIVAILHDIIEDTDVTEFDLINMGFDKDIVNAVVLLTKTDGEEYFDYIRRVRDSGIPYTYWVKIADLEHNSDLSRLKEVTEKDLKRVQKYRKALDILFRNIE